MDELLFSRCLNREGCTAVVETTSCFEILNYVDTDLNSFMKEALSPADDFANFVNIKGTYARPHIKDEAMFRDGIRLVVQHNIVNSKDTFSPDVISLHKDAYELMIRGMNLPLRGIQTNSVVGPFFWWEYDPDPTDPHIYLILRKSDVKWEKESRGFELMLSYSFRRRLTSGYLKGTKYKEVEDALLKTRDCAAGKACHPLLLPLLLLENQLSGENDTMQRNIRAKLRGLEKALSRRYENQGDGSASISAGRVGSNRENGSIYPPTRLADEESGGSGTVGDQNKDEWELDKLNCQLVELQCKVMWKRPQAWQTVVGGMEKAEQLFWAKVLDVGKTANLGRADRDVKSYLDFVRIKLDGLEHYAHVSLERLNLQRQVMDSIIMLRESRVSLKVAAQQSSLARITQRDSTSMKTLAMLGALFLPGTWLSSLLGLSFFDFDKDASKLWIYFVSMGLMTVVVMIIWKVYDRHFNKETMEDEQAEEAHMERIGNQAMHWVRRQTTTRVA